MGGSHYFEDLREGAEKDDYPKGRGEVRRGFAGLIEDDAQGAFEGPGMEPMRQQGVQQG